MIDRVHQDRSAAPLASPKAAAVYEGRIARIHRAGDPLRYRWGDEFRDDAELERIRSQAVGKTFVLLHPESTPENKYGMVLDGAKHHAIGTIISARIDGDWVVAEFVITDADGIAAIQGGMHELSLGYRCRADASGFQRETHVDHVALVPRGRCGDTCALRADEVRTDCGCESSDAIRHESPPVVVEVQACACKGLANPLDLGQSAIHMPTADELQKQLDEAKAESDAQRARADQAEQSLEEQKKAREAAELEAHNAKKDLESRADAEKLAVAAAIATEKVRADEAEKTRDAEKARADALQASMDAKIAEVRADAEAQVAARVESKLDLISQVSMLNLVVKNDKGEDEAMNLVKTNDRDIKLAAILHVDGDDLSSKNDGWVDGVFASAMKRRDSAMESRKTAATAITEVKTIVDDKKTDNDTTGRAAIAAAQAKRNEQLSSAWKTSTEN